MINLLVKLYESELLTPAPAKQNPVSGDIRSSDPAGDTIIFRSSDIIDSRTGFRCANVKVSTWLLPVLVRTSAVLLLFHKTENMFGTASANVKVF